MDIIKEILLALITGCYSGIVISKYWEFRNLREEGSKILQKGLTAKEIHFELELICSSLNRLGHEKAAETLSQISKDYYYLGKNNSIVDDNGEVTLPSLDEVVQIHDTCNDLRIRVNNLKASWFSIIFPFL